MNKESKTEITGNFDLNIPEVFPFFVSGADAKAVYEHMQETFGKGVWYEEESKTMLGSNFPIAARLDTMLKNLKENPLELRVATLADLSRPEVMKMIEGEHYSDTPALVLRTEKDSYEPNNAIIKQLLPHIEEKQGRLQLPLMITGLDAILDKNTEYGWNIVPRDYFSVVYDDKLEGKHNVKRFSRVDEIGFPIFDENGKRTLYARDKGLSGLCLVRDFALNSGGGDLADSGEYGRVVLIAAKPSTRKS